MPAAVGAATLLFSMDRDDYERRKAALEEIYRADLDLIRRAHEARLRSLEELWRAEAPAAPSEPPPPPAPKPAPAAPVRRQPTPHLRTALEEILPDLPAEFGKKDLIAALGWTPSRGALYRALLDLAIARVIKIEPSLGRHPSKYRKVG